MWSSPFSYFLLMLSSVRFRSTYSTNVCPLSWMSRPPRAKRLPIIRPSRNIFVAFYEELYNYIISKGFDVDTCMLSYFVFLIAWLFLSFPPALL